MPEIRVNAKNSTLNTKSKFYDIDYKKYIVLGKNRKRKGENHDHIEKRGHVWLYGLE